MKHVVKRAGHSEEYDERKVYASAYSACLMVRESHETAEMIAAKVTELVNEWLQSKHEITTDDLRRKISEFLKLFDDDAAHIFKHQRNLGR
jgi:transcriptional regulator NrdR family protein